ncbi:MAG: hypothetical protein Q9162_004749 [Coniocarpon cinnabarinum]
MLTCNHSPETLTHHPPDLSDEQMRRLVDDVKDYQITHGSLIKLVREEEPHTVPAVPIGVSLFPTPFPRHCFDRAVALQATCNKLYSSVAQDDAWLFEALKSLIAVDDFVRCLWDIKCAASQEGIVQDISLGIFRSDYMLHGSTLQDATIKQVEMNTFSVAGATHGNIVANMHHSMRQQGHYSRLCPHLQAGCTAAPRNNVMQGVAEALAYAFHLYGASKAPSVKGLCILMIVQPFNVNICDERPLEYWLRDKLGIPCFRAVFGDEVLRTSHLTGSRELLFSGRGDSEALAKTLSDDADALSWEVAVVYHRAGYEPKEYATAEGREARLRLETSRAIKCPSMSGHLATLKHVQRALSEPGALRRFLTDEEASLISNTFMPMYALDDNSEGQRLAKRIATGQDAENHVLKPALEGGGHNIFSDDITDFLQQECGSQSPPQDWQKFVLMERIHPPLIEGCMISPVDVYEGPVVSELGIFGAAVWSETRATVDPSQSMSESPVALKDCLGWSLKTKSRFVDEMSVIKGYGCFDSPLLFDLQQEVKNIQNSAT